MFLASEVPQLLSCDELDPILPDNKFTEIKKKYVEDMQRYCLPSFAIHTLI
jgi:hypothetical protein